MLWFTVSIDSEIVAQKDRIAKQATDFEELKKQFNDALHKVLPFLFLMNGLF